MPRHLGCFPLTVEVTPYQSIDEKSIKVKREKTMGKVTILPDNLCNQIAAGEVVERPAAVVKELVENSLDAESRKITVRMLQGGRKEVRVVDNGLGMSPEDALLALDRHATSKIRSLDDLQSIRSLGFRGEALPSIAAVSRFELATREPEAVAGTLIRIEGGILRDVRETGCPAGTMVTVRDLFHNIPVRRKFLRSVDTEMAHISDQFLRLSLAHPEVHFQLAHEERLLYDFPKTNSLADRAGQVLGIELAGKLRPFELQRPPMVLRGLAGRPDLQRANSQALFVYVNGRPIRDRALNYAILNAYDTLTPKGKYPVVALFVELPPALVDVNVHPTKREVRFRSPGEIIEAVRFAVRKALEDAQAQGRMSSHPSWVGLASTGPYASRSQYTRETQVPIKDGSNAGLQGPPNLGPPVQVDGFRSAFPPAGTASMRAPGLEAGLGMGLGVEGGVGKDEGRGVSQLPRAGLDAAGPPLFSRLLIIGQLANSYILLESEDGGLVIIDQHAAHERIVYDRLSSSSTKPAGQRLLRSAVVELLPKEAVVLRRWLDPLRQLGFEMESFGGDSFVIHAVPAALCDYSPEDLIRDLLKTSHEEEAGPRLDLMAGLAKTVACHEAIRAGRKLRTEEMIHLLETLDRLAISATCPHGRPLWYKLTPGEIARFFHRT
jgi:DNA mismatch repair protein MutL